VNEPEIIDALAALLTPALDGAQHERLAELCADLPCGHPLALLASALHGEACRLYPPYAALCAQVNAGGDPSPEQWSAAVDAGQARESYGRHIRAVVTDSETQLAEQIRSGVLHKGTVLATLMLLRDGIRARDPQLAEQLVMPRCEAATPGGDA